MADSDAPPPPPPPPAQTAPEEPVLFPGLLPDPDAPRPPPGPRRRARKKPRAEMGFFEHLEELRMTIIRCIMAALAGMLITGVFYTKVFQFLQYPLYVGLGPGADTVLRSPIAPMGSPIMMVSVSIYGGIILALPLIAYFIVQFVAPGLTEREKGMIRPTLYAGLALFFTGALACFFILLPAALRFSHFLDQETGVTTQWTADTYYSLVVWATAATGLVFEFPLVLVILQVLGVISPDTLRGFRRYAIVIIAVVGGFIAPSPDVVSMLSMMVPMIILYEGAIIVGGILRRRKLAAEARRAADEAG